MQTRSIGFLKAFGAALGLAVLMCSVGCSKKDEDATASSASYDRQAQAKSAAGSTAPAEGNGYSQGAATDTNGMIAGAGGMGGGRGAPMHYAARQPGAERSVSRQASLTVEVENLDKAEKKMRESITAAGGYIDHLEGDNLAGDQPVMHLTIRVPEKTFDGTLEGFENLGHRTQKSISASDLTEETLALEAQIKQDQRQVDATGKLYSADQIKQLQAEKDALAAKAAMSTIDLTLQQKANAALATAANASWGSDAWNSAMTSAMGAFRVIGAVAIWLLVFSPIWGAIVVACVYGARLRRRHLQGQRIA